MAPSRLRVLIIGDEYAWRSISRLLAPFYETREANDGAAGVVEALSGTHDVVFCNANLRGMGCAQLLSEVTARRPDIARRIVLIGGAPPPEPGLLAACSGRFVGRPFSKRALERAIAAVVVVKRTPDERVA